MQEEQEPYEDHYTAMDVEPFPWKELCTESQQVDKELRNNRIPQNVASMKHERAKHEITMQKTCDQEH